MTGVVLDSYSGGDALRVEQRPVPTPGHNEVLVQVAASPINPSDLAFLEGRYGFKSAPPVIPGLEGSGTVVAVGSGMMGRYLLGKRVACLHPGEGDGVWAEYVVSTAKGGALPLHQSVSLEQGAMSVVNPLTAMAFLEIAKKGGHKAIVQTAAASALGQMVNRLAQSEGVQVINVFRREAQVELLEQQGATIVLSSNESDFDQRLHDACHQHKAHLALDAVAGRLTLQLLEALPRHGRVTVYGGLSYKPAQASPDQLIFQDKAVDGFWLGPWLAKKNLIQMMRMWRRAQRLLSTQLRSDVRARFPFQEAREAVQDYQSQMTGGKVLLRS
jgi:NADPH:quinone reductase-like Zn-dependent oxidoreductase